MCKLGLGVVNKTISVRLSDGGNNVCCIPNDFLSFCFIPVHVQRSLKMPGEGKVSFFFTFSLICYEFQQKNR